MLPLHVRAHKVMRQVLSAGIVTYLGSFEEEAAGGAGAFTRTRLPITSLLSG